MNGSIIVIGDDHPQWCAGLREPIQALLPEVPVREAHTLDAVVKEVEKSRDNVELVLLDLVMPGCAEGLAGLLLLRKLFPAVPVAICSALTDPVTIRKAIVLGASGYIPKTLKFESIQEAIKRMRAGDIWVPPGLSLTSPAGGEEMELARRFALLSPRQLQILNLIRLGKPNKIIADELDVHIQTVRAHVSAIFDRLGLKNRNRTRNRTRTLAAILAERFLNGN
ncbi:MAG: response regulator transcription factor [Beijerinckiaceae bacterium]|nr:response regulator transcription factor [Beijerinckiaceae bacterium]